MANNAGDLPRVTARNLQRIEVERHAEWLSVQERLPALEREPPRAEPVHGERVDDVLASEHIGRQCLGRVVRVHRNARLDDDGAAIQVLRHPVDARAMLGIAGFERAAVGVQAGEAGQQRGVNVEHAALVAGDERCGEYAHETGEDYEIGRKPLDGLRQRGVERLASRKITVINDLRRDADHLRPGKAAGVSAIADDSDDFTMNSALATRINQRLKVAAAARDQDDDPAALWPFARGLHYLPVPDARRLGLARLNDAD